ncbi:MAG TPA: patatin-like phospholipase family protein [Polyangiaceae bacterium]|nr:patatin-like phospholipase family protein [Polyangiaceae bacterium]
MGWSSDAERVEPKTSGERGSQPPSSQLEPTGNGPTSSTIAHRVPLSRPPGDATPRRSLVLTGGGRRVAYQAGALRALEEAGLAFDHADATSAGTVNLAMLFSGLAPGEMCSRWRTLGERSSSSLLPPVEALGSRRPTTPVEPHTRRRHALAELGVDITRINAATGMDGTFNIGNFSSRTNRAVSHRDLGDDQLLAAISLPGLTPPVRIDGDEYVDSVCIQNANLLEAVRRGAEEIWLLWCSGGTPRYRIELPSPYEQMIEMSGTGSLEHALRYIAELNERIRRGDSPWGQRAPIRLKVIKPDCPLPLDSGLPGAIDGALLDLGYADAWRRLRERDSDDALEAAATSTRRAPAGVAFNERFTGSLRSLAPNTPGFESGAAVSVELSSTVLIGDLPAFLSDPSRVVELAGSVLWDGVSLGLRDGGFRAETRPEAGERRLIYTASFEPIPGLTCHLRLERSLIAGSATLMRGLLPTRVSVHRGPDASAPILASGVLDMRADDVTTCCRTLQALEPESPREGARAIVQLGRFLFGELYDSSTGRPWWKVW